MSDLEDDYLYAINPNGQQAWSFATGGPIWSSPAINVDGTVYVGSWDNKLYAVNADGTQKWAFTTGSIIDSSPLIGTDGTIFVGSADWNLYAVNPDGSQQWRSPKPPQSTPPRRSARTSSEIITPCMWALKTAC